MIIVAIHAFIKRCLLHRCRINNVKQAGSQLPPKQESIRFPVCTISKCKSDPIILTFSMKKSKVNAVVAQADMAGRMAKRNH